jgi:putative hydrolase of the HAD superfamily
LAKLAHCEIVPAAELNGFNRRLVGKDLAAMIKNVIFDVGNVFVRWSPSEIIWRSLNLEPESEQNRHRADAIFRSPIWMSLNLGQLTQVDAEAAFQRQFGLTKGETARLFFHVMDHQEPIHGTEQIARRLVQAGYRVFGLTDNVHEIVTHLKSRYRFWELFEGAVVSAEVGLKKPHQAIFRHAIQTYGLVASQTVFFDDVQANVDGARSIGMEARLFTTADRCEHDLRALGLSF